MSTNRRFCQVATESARRLAWLALACLAGGCVFLLRPPGGRGGDSYGDPPPAPLDLLDPAQARSLAVEAASTARGADATHLVDEARVEYLVSEYGWSLDPLTRIGVHRATVVHRSEGLERAAFRLVTTAGTRVEGLRARTLLPDGRAVEVAADAMVRGEAARSGGAGGQTYSVTTFAFPEARPGAIVEYAYTLRRLGWAPDHTFAVDPTAPTRDAMLEVRSPLRVELRAVTRGFDGPTEGASERFAWRARDLAAAARELPLALPPGRTAPRVSFSVRRFVYGSALMRHGIYGQTDAYTDWSAVASDYWKALAPALTALPATDAALAPPAGVTDAARRAAVAWARVQEHVHPRGAVTEERDAAPRTPEQVWRSGFGTANERALLLVALLRAWGVEAGVGAFPGDDAGDAVDGFPSTAGLDDWLVWVAAPPPAALLLLLDPGCLGCAAGELTLAHRGRRGLLVRDWCSKPERAESCRASSVAGTTGDLYTTAAAGGPPRPRALRLDVDVTARGLVARRGRWEAHGAEAAAVRHYFSQHPLPPAALQEKVRRRYLDGVEEGRVWVGGLDDAAGPVVFDVEGVVVNRDEYVDANPWHIIPLPAVTGGEWIERLDAGRTEVVHFEEAPSADTTVRIDVPSGYELVSLPLAGQVSRGPHVFSLRVTHAQGAVHVAEVLHVAHRTIPADAHAEFMAFVGEVRALRRQSVVLRRTGG